MNGLIAGRFSGTVGEFSIDITFETPASGVTGIVGPSGSGKTTLLRCLAGLERLSGTLFVDGQVWQDADNFLRPERRRVGLVFQGLNLLPHLNVADNLAYAARRAGPGPFDPADVLDGTGIGGLLHRTPARLSGGEGRRVAIARALLSQPRLLLMDEPLAGLDEAARGEVLDRLRALFASYRLPVFYVSHDATEIDRVSDRRVAIDNGRVVSS